MDANNNQVVKTLYTDYIVVVVVVIVYHIQCIIHKESTSMEMTRQLYVLQCLLFNLLDEKRRTTVEANDQVSRAR